jgi:hypothetical protein
MALVEDDLADSEPTDVVPCSQRVLSVGVMR